MNQYTSFELSKKLLENGAKIEDRIFYYPDYKNNQHLIDLKYQKVPILINKLTPAYDILWDICIRYAKEFFGDEIIPPEFSFETDIEAYYFYPQQIFAMIQNKNSQEEIEKYIWHNCVFNPAYKLRSGK
jgi:hypothetical protein